MSLVSSCSANTAELDLVFNENDDFSIRVRIDYVCIGNANETVSGNLHGYTVTVLNYYGLLWSCYLIKNISYYC